MTAPVATLKTSALGAKENQTDDLENSFMIDALDAHKREGLLLAVRGRWAALAVIAVLTIALEPRFDSLFYLASLVLFALIGFAQLKMGKSGVSRTELFLMFCDLALLTYVMVAPNPLSDHEIPPAAKYRFSNFLFFFVLLAGGTLAYSWRTVVAMGIWTAGLWSVGLVWVLLQPEMATSLSGQILSLVAGNPDLERVLDLNNADVPRRVQEVVVFLIVAVILAVGARRANELLLEQARTNRRRANLARYFSPTVVEELSLNDEQLKQTRTQHIAILFVDIAGFTSLSQNMTPQQTIELLNRFHGAMEAEVFAHGGTLDKYLGDGLMATFGTPVTTDNDAANALACAGSMIAALKKLNEEAAKTGEPEIKAGFGLHFGEVVLGNIGTNRLEFAVIGASVNAAARLESLTRQLKVQLVASDALVAAAKKQAVLPGVRLPDLHRREPCKLKGFDQPMDIWTDT